MSLRLDWCSHEAAKFACEKWHYSKCCPVGKINAIGVWEFGKYIGCILFSHGACANISKPYGLTQQEVIELTRIALNSHISPVSKISAIAIKLVKRQNPGLKLIVSYADPNQGHIGTIYQAGNWIYTGSIKQAHVLINGKVVHPRSAHAKYGTTKGLVWTEPLVKYKYLYPLTDDMRSKIEPLRKPYPKRASVVHNVEQPAYQQGEGGSIPTLTHIRTGKEPVRING